MSTPASLNGQELELFRVGNYGAKGNYSAADLQDLAARYSSSDQAAITIGHPASDSEPAFGWIKSVRFAGDKLLGTPGEVVPHIDSLVQAGAYKHRSIGLSRGTDGKLRLRHVALLGAVPPAVQGLAPAHFSNDPFQEFALEGDGMADEQIDQKVEAGITRFFSNLFGKKPEAGTVDEQALESRLEAKFSAQLAQERTARQAVEQQFADHKKATVTSAAQARAQQAVVDLKTSGHWVPAYDAIGVPAIFSALAETPQEITFSDKDGKEVKTDLLSAFSGVLTKVGKIVPAGQVFSVQQGQAAQAGATPEANGIDVDASSVSFSDMVTQRSTEKNIPYTEAYKQLVAEGKKPAAGSAAAGAV